MHEHVSEDENGTKGCEFSFDSGTIENSICNYVIDLLLVRSIY